MRFIFFFVYVNWTYTYAQEAASLQDTLLLKEEAQLKAKAEEIVQKATVIYRLEKAAWKAGDLLETNKPIKAPIESYLSYITDSITTCVFYSRTDSVFAQYDFTNVEGEPNPQFVPRKCTDRELSLIKIKRTVRDKLPGRELKKIRKGDETTFNLVPLYLNHQPSCYLINAMNNSSKMILGYDYIIRLDSAMHIKEVSGNHKSAHEIPFELEAKSFFHTHVLTHGFWETELATLMLYKPYLKTKVFVAMSNYYTSTWDNETNTLIIK